MKCMSSINTIVHVLSCIVHSLHLMHILISVVFHCLYSRIRCRRHHIESMHRCHVTGCERSLSHVTGCDVTIATLREGQWLVFAGRRIPEIIFWRAVRFQYWSMIIGEGHRKQSLWITYKLVHISLSGNLLHDAFLVVVPERSTQLVVVHGGAVLL